MPQATSELRRKFPGSDSEALSVIAKNFVVVRNGHIHPKEVGYKPTQREHEAIDYLFQEWDYTYSPDFS